MTRKVATSLAAVVTPLPLSVTVTVASYSPIWPAVGVQVSSASPYTEVGAIVAPGNPATR